MYKRFPRVCYPFFSIVDEVELIINVFVCVLSLRVYFEIDVGVYISLIHPFFFAYIVDKKFIYILGLTVRRDTIFYRPFYEEKKTVSFEISVLRVFYEHGNVVML